MEIEKIYTLRMHKALQNAIRNNNRIDYTPAGGFIKNLYNTSKGVIFKYNTLILTTSAITADSFLMMNYKNIIADLKECYNKTITNNLYQLKKEFQQERYTSLYPQ